MLRTSHSRRELKRLIRDLVLAAIAIAALALLTSAGALSGVGQLLAQYLKF